MHAKRWVHSIGNETERQKGKTENRFDFIPFFLLPLPTPFDVAKIRGEKASEKIDQTQ